MKRPIRLYVAVMAPLGALVGVAAYVLLVGISGSRSLQALGLPFFGLLFAAYLRSVTHGWRRAG